MHTAIGEASRVLVAIEDPLEMTRLVAAAAMAAAPGALVEGVHVTGTASDAGERAARASLSVAIRSLRARGIATRCLICCADRESVARELARRADVMEADLLIVGSGPAGRGTVPSRWSVSRRILALTGRPVLIVPEAAGTVPGGACRPVVPVDRAADLDEAIDHCFGLPDRPEILVRPPARPQVRR